jgi:hypothetical protein
VSGEPFLFGEIAIVGGGCYGGFYTGQLEAARARRKVAYHRLTVVDRDPSCKVAGLPDDPSRRVVVAEWNAFFDEYLARDRPANGPRDLIVPSPLMPHLLYEWAARRARSRWPGRVVEARPLEARMGTPFETVAPTPDATTYASFADWLCPTHCVEPAVCPVIRAPRTWDMAEATADLTARLGKARPAAGPVLFECRHVVHGVGAIRVDQVLAGDRIVADAGAAGGAVDVVVGTVSGCHGAISVLHLGPASREPAAGYIS